MKKVPISIRLDPDIIEFFKSRQSTAGYQTAISCVLRDHVEKDRLRRVFAAGRAQELFRQYHAQCFWHMRPDLVITQELVPVVIQGLRRYGGRQGFQLAHELDQSWAPIREDTPCP